MWRQGNKVFVRIPGETLTETLRPPPLPPAPAPQLALAAQAVQMAQLVQLALALVALAALANPAAAMMWLKNTSH